MITITVANQKGGVGKTTTAVTLAHGLARKDYNVLIIDLDPQGQCAPLLRMSQGQYVYRYLTEDWPLRQVALATGRDYLWLMPGNEDTHAAEIMGTIKGQGKDRLATLLGKQPMVNGTRLHYIVLDTAPTVGELQIAALFAADILVMPVATDHLALAGVKKIMGTMHNVVRRDDSPTILVLPTFYDEVTKESQQNHDLILETFPDRVLPPIHRATILRECAALGKTIFERDPGSRAAREYQVLVKGVLHG